MKQGAPSRRAGIEALKPLLLDPKLSERKAGVVVAGQVARAFRIYRDDQHCSCSILVYDD